MWLSSDRFLRFGHPSYDSGGPGADTSSQTVWFIDSVVSYGTKTERDADFQAIEIDDPVKHAVDTTNGTLEVARSLLSDEERNLFDESERILWTDRYRNWPTTLLGDRTVGIIPIELIESTDELRVVKGNTLAQKLSLPLVRLNADGPNAVITTRGQSMVVAPGETETLDLQEKRVEISTHDSTDDGRASGTAIPQISVRNYGQLKLRMHD